MSGSLARTERVFRFVLGVTLALVAATVGLTSHGTEARVVAWGAFALAAVALITAGMGSAGRLARFGLNENWSLGYVAARLFVGWEFLYAGWDKATSNWYHGAGSGEVNGFLTGAVGQSHASAASPFPGVSHWFSWTASNVFIPHSELLSYLVVTAELCVGIGLILGLFLRLSAFFGVTLNALFLLSGSLSAGLNPEMLILGMAVMLGVAPAVYALSLDRVFMHRLRGISMRPAHIHPQVTTR